MTKKWKIILIATDAALFCAFLLFSLYLRSNSISFNDGYYRTNQAFGMTLLVLPVSLMYVLFSVGHFLFWKRVVKVKSKAWLIGNSLVLCVPVMLLLLPGRSPGYVAYTQGFHQRMSEELKVESVRQWLSTLDDAIFEDAKSGQKADEFMPSDIRDAIRTAGHGWVQFYRTQEGFKCVRITTGAGGISTTCGVVIGPEEMSVPPVEEAAFDETGKPLRHKEYRIRLEDGAYVWHD